MRRATSAYPVRDSEHTRRDLAALKHSLEIRESYENVTKKAKMKSPTIVTCIIMSKKGV